MRFIKLFLVVLLSFGGKAQIGHGSVDKSVYFAQCLLKISTESDFIGLENQLRLLPEIDVVRVDVPTRRLFLLTKELNELSNEDFNYWLGSFSKSYYCLQIGLYGIDTINRYPFSNCKDDLNYENN